MGVATQRAKWKLESERIPIWNSDWSEKRRDDEERRDFCEKSYSDSNFTIDNRRTLLYKKETQLGTSQVPTGVFYIEVIGRARTTGKTEDTQWHCLNRECGWSAVMSINVEDVAPRCVCGAPMQRSAMAPVMSYFDFLRGDDSLRADGKREEE
jgi:hypothetical protein